MGRTFLINFFGDPLSVQSNGPGVAEYISCLVGADVLERMERDAGVADI